MSNPSLTVHCNGSDSELLGSAFVCKNRRGMNHVSVEWSYTHVRCAVVVERGEIRFLLKLFLPSAPVILRVYIVTSFNGYAALGSFGEPSTMT
ncbi:hypothetical protein TNCV_460371 [Trichonephila clavipes]|nr:hypothetical protein TNCV_460371 [Trichonephila clavipes]